MAVGPGKYDDLCTYVREDVEADGVILIVFGGRLGSGFSVQAPFGITLEIPRMLRDIAEQIDRDDVQ